MGIVMTIDRKEYLELKRVRAVLFAENEQLKKENETLKNKLNAVEKRSAAKTETKKEANK